MDKAIFAAGCFWGVEESFRKLKGIISTTVGYTGGNTVNPTYKEVCNENTGHAEAIMIEFDPKIISYNFLLEIFWKIHDPSTMNRQGPDVGSQYRSAIFYVDDEQKENVIKSKKDEEKRIEKEIVTEIVKFDKFYPAEKYHQKYIMKTGRNVC